MANNVEVVRQLLSAFNRRDLEGTLELMDAGVEFYAPQTALAVGRDVPYQGHEGVRRYLGDVNQVFEELTVVPEEFRANGEEVVALGAVTGKRDGEVLDDRVAWAWRLRGGKIVWGRVYQDPAQALEDVGIVEREPSE
jgi:ketosteroid isomerase-like protein